MLGESWKIKKSLASSISPTFIDDIYHKGLKAGALGGKLLGAGGGGFIIFYVTPDRRQEVLDSLSDLLLIPFVFEEEGSKIVFNEKQQYSNTATSGKDFLKRN